MSDLRQVADSVTVRNIFGALLHHDDDISDFSLVPDRPQSNSTNRRQGAIESTSTTTSTLKTATHNSVRFSLSSSKSNVNTRTIVIDSSDDDDEADDEVLERSIRSAASQAHSRPVQKKEASIERVFSYVQPPTFQHQMGEIPTSLGEDEDEQEQTEFQSSF
jgi:hypothetical protein